MQPFDITLWQKGQPVITLAGRRPTIFAFNKDAVHGSVDGKELAWHPDGLAVDRDNREYDLFMK